MTVSLQCDCGDQNADLIACARYTVQGELQQVRQDRTADIHSNMSDVLLRSKHDLQ
jgi:hypothetical protein